MFGKCLECLCMKVIVIILCDYFMCSDSELGILVIVTAHHRRHQVTVMLTMQSTLSHRLVQLSFHVCLNLNHVD